MKKIILEEIYNKLDRAKKISYVYPDESIRMSKEVCMLANSENLKLEKAHAYLNIALTSRIKSDTSSMLENSYKALSIFETKNDFIGQAKAMNLIGISCFYSSMYDESLKFFLDSKKTLEINKNDSILTSILNKINIEQQKIVLFMIDIDKFKRYNDFWGHAEGDVCLRKIANSIKKIQISKGDMFGRYGGEEFIYIYRLYPVMRRHLNLVI